MMTRLPLHVGNQTKTAIIPKFVGLIEARMGNRLHVHGFTLKNVDLYEKHP
jgi:hypothetical protein